MKPTKHFLLIAFLLMVKICPAQTETNALKPFIEVTGTARLEIVPDEIFINIGISERMDGKTRISVDEQETKLKELMKAEGIDTKNLYVAHANAAYVKTRREKGVVTSASYTLKVSNAAKVAKVFECVEKLDIQEAYVAQARHSKLDSLKKATRINAMKAAKDKADYLLAPIGESTGKAVVVRENTIGYGDDDFRPFRGNVYQTHNYLANDSASWSTESEEIQFEKIVIEESVYVKFLIK
jgi:uncharacterized protein YggE